jgi:beta-galactosidase
VVDRYETSFGIRTIRFDADHGFFLNGKHVEIKGTDDHQDHAGVGVAVPDTLNAFRVERLKAMGSNAIRTSHNPPTPELLDACDRLGMLVLDENRAMGVTPEDYGQFRRMIARDRNHPSVVLWSIGNEEWSLEWSAFWRAHHPRYAGIRQAARSHAPFTVALSGSGAGNSLSADVLGFNYYVQHHIDEMHARFPLKPIVGTEESSSEHTRGIYADDLAHQHLVAYDFEADGHHVSVEEGWRYYLARPLCGGPLLLDGLRLSRRDYTVRVAGHQLAIRHDRHLRLLQRQRLSAPVLVDGKADGPPAAPLELVGQGGPAHRCARLQQRRCDRTLHQRQESGPQADAAQLASGMEGCLTSRACSWRADTTPPAARSRATRWKQPARQLPSSSFPTWPRSAPTANRSRWSRCASTMQPGASCRTAGNLVSFSLTGPGRIIGVGNGDPASHEPDKYIETVRAIPVAKWRTRSIDARD